VHEADNRVYVTNWAGGALLAFDIDTLERVRTYPFPAASLGYVSGDVYKVAAGGMGRVIVEGEDQWVDMSVYDTVNAEVLVKTNVREGGGSYSPDGRYYYHGDNNSSGCQLTKYDTVADKLTSVKSVSAPTGSHSYYGSRTVVVSADGKRIFWNGVAFDSGLEVVWAFGQVVYATSADGRYAFSDTKIYDIDERQVIFGMPGATTVSGFNAATARLVVQKGDGIGFYTLDATIPLVAPVLSVVQTSATTATLSWTNESLQIGFTLQKRTVGASEWTDVASGIAASDNNVVQGLSSETAYEFRVKGDGAVVSSAWSNVVVATTTVAPPVVLSAGVSRSIAEGGTVSFEVVAAGSNLNYQWQRHAESNWGEWVNIENGGHYAGATTANLTVENTTLAMSGDSFRCVVSNPGGESIGGGGWLTVTVDRSGIYFGTLTGGRGQWAMRITKENTAVFLAYFTQRKSAAFVELNINQNGDFYTSGYEQVATVNGDGVAQPLAVGSWFSLWGQITETGLTGEMGQIGESFSGAVVATGENASTGYYMAEALHTGSGQTHAIVAPDGQALVVTLTPTLVDAASGTLDGNGNLNTTTSGGASMSLSLTSTGQISAALTPAGGTTPIGFAGLSDEEESTTRLVAISTRSQAGRDDRTLIMGFVIAGSGNKQLVTRGVGPSLQALGVTQALSDPQLKLFNQAGQLIDQNDNWGGSTEMTQTFARLGMSPPLAADSKDAAFVRTTNPGIYTAHVASGAEATGTALIEVYDGDLEGTSRFTALSTRTVAGTGEESLIAGVVLEGNAPKRLLIRGVGPTLVGQGISEASVLTDPQLVIHRFINQGAVLVAQNDNWGGSYELKATFAGVGLGQFQSDTSKDAALIVTLAPGIYTMQLSAANNAAAGVALLEIYELP
jgi:hypothetical protein